MDSIVVMLVIILGTQIGTSLFGIFSLVWGRRKNVYFRFTISMWTLLAILIANILYMGIIVYSIGGELGDPNRDITGDAAFGFLYIIIVVMFVGASVTAFVVDLVIALVKIGKDNANEAREKRMK